MRSALALSALLLLPLLSGEGPVITKTSTQPSLAAMKPARSEGQTADVSTASSPASAPTKQMTTAATTGRPSTATSSSGATAAPAPKSTTQTSATQDEKTFSKPTMTSDGPNDGQSAGKVTLPSTTKFTKPEATTSQPAGGGAQDTPALSTSHASTAGREQAAPRLSSISSPTSLSAITAPASPHQPGTDPPTSKPPASPSEGPHSIPTVAPSSPGTKAGPTSTSPGTPTAPTSLVTLQGNLQKSSTMSAVTGTSSSTTGTSSSTTGTSSSTTGIPSVPGAPSPESPQPAGPSSRPVATSPVERPRSPSTQLTSVAPQVSNVPPPSSAHADDRIKCESPEKLTDKMLVLNLTKTSLCAGNSSSDDKLVTLLCRAAKATFNPAQDKCRIRLVPVQGSQAVVIKEITVQTNLLPRAVYESLKDKWDDLREVGVSNMRLGDQGPPEETEDRFSMPLIITIVCMASFLLLVAALYGCCHQRLSQRKDQQRLTEELQTVENGYHDNPTLEVMETSSEMQEKKVVNLNGELGDSWIVPLDNLAKDDLDEEEDTHL